MTLPTPPPPSPAAATDAGEGGAMLTRIGDTVKIREGFVIPASWMLPDFLNVAGRSGSVSFVAENGQVYVTLPGDGRTGGKGLFCGGVFGPFWWCEVEGAEASA